MPGVAARDHKEYMKSLKNKAAALISERKENLRRGTEFKCDPNDVWQMKQYLAKLKNTMTETSDETMVKIDWLRKELEGYHIGPVTGKLGILKELYLQEIKELELKGLREEFNLTQELKKKVDKLTKQINMKVHDLDWRPEEWPWRQVEPTTLPDLEQQYRNIEAMKLDDDMRLIKSKAILQNLSKSYKEVEKEANENIKEWSRQREKLILQRDEANNGRINGSSMLVQHRCKEKAAIQKISSERSSLLVGNQDINQTNTGLNDSFGSLMKHWNAEARDSNLNMTLEIEKLTSAINQELQTKKVLASLKFCTRDIEELFRKKEIADETFEMHFANLIVALRSKERLNKENVDAFLGEIKEMEEVMQNTHFVLENQVTNFENLVAKDPQSTIPALAGHNNVKVLINKYDRFITAYARGFSFYV